MSAAPANIDEARAPSAHAHVGGRAFIDLHCHTSASFDSLADPAKVVRAAAARGLTHLVVTDHDRIDGALRARDAAAPGLTVIIGQEVRTKAGDLIAAFIERPIERDLPAVDAIAAIRAQGGLVGMPHPYDQFRSSLMRDALHESLMTSVDWIEVHNARLVGSGNEHAAEAARQHERPGVAVSDAHTVLEVAVAYTVLDGDPSTPAGLLAALPPAELVTGRATYAVRLWTPVAKGVQRVRGNGRSRPSVGA
jgi:predicted metal-dependent phosphoesterase TrpH